MARNINIAKGSPGYAIINIDAVSMDIPTDPAFKQIPEALYQDNASISFFLSKKVFSFSPFNDNISIEGLPFTGTVEDLRNEFEKIFKN
jgi:hypothetical protein